MLQSLLYQLTCFTCLLFKSLESLEGGGGRKTCLDPLHPSLRCPRSSSCLHSNTSSLHWLPNSTHFLQQRQEGSLALLPRKILPICIATLRSSSSASPCSGTVCSGPQPGKGPSAPWRVSPRPGLLGTVYRQASWLG